MRNWFVQIMVVNACAHLFDISKIKTKQITYINVKNQKEFIDWVAAKTGLMLEMQTPRAIRVTHSYNKCDAIFECHTFCSSDCIRAIGNSGHFTSIQQKYSSYAFLARIFICLRFQHRNTKPNPWKSRRKRRKKSVDWSSSMRMRESPKCGSIAWR